MPLIRIVRVKEYETGIVFRRGTPRKRLDPGRHLIVGFAQVQKYDRRQPSILDERLHEIAQSELINDCATLVDLADNQRGLIWIDGRFLMALSPGLYAFWNQPHDVRVEVLEIDGGGIELQHRNLPSITQSSVASALLDVFRVEAGTVGVKQIDGQTVGTVEPGLYAFWRCGRKATLVEVDTRDSQMEISGQELMTADRVTLRLNVNLVFRVTQPQRAVETTADVHQALYRECQLALRTAIGLRELDSLLGDRDALTDELMSAISAAAERIGVELVSIGLRDVILPGDMKTLLNRVVEAKKAAEANLITRREETAAIRSQANTAKLLADNPALMRLRELETLERVATSGNLQILVGDGGLSEKLTKLI